MFGYAGLSKNTNLLSWDIQKHCFIDQERAEIGLDWAKIQLNWPKSFVSLGKANIYKFNGL